LLLLVGVVTPGLALMPVRSAAQVTEAAPRAAESSPAEQLADAALARPDALEPPSTEQQIPPAEHPEAAAHDASSGVSPPPAPQISSPLAEKPAPPAEPAKPAQEPGEKSALWEHVRLSGLLQVDAVTFDQSSVDELDLATRAPLNQERFVLRRGRVGVEAHFGLARGQIQIEGSTAREPSVRVLSAELGLAYPSSDAIPLVEAALGLFFIPFGFETSELAPSRLFLEASTWSTALFPGRRDLGARVSGGWAFLRYALAVMNGNPSLGPLSLRDPNRKKDLVGRLGADGRLFAWLRVSAGVSGLLGHGFHPGAAPTKDQIVVRDINEDGLVQLTEVTLIPGHPGDASRNFERHALGADLAFDYDLPRLGPGRVYGELAWAQNLDRGLFVSDPIAQGRDVTELGFMVAFRQHVTRHAEIGARYDYYDPDQDASRRHGLHFVPGDASFSTLAAVVAWCSLPHVRVTLQYDHRKNPLGRSQSGAPTTLSADSFTLRGQLSF
jgi:hypothetical protein